MAFLVSPLISKSLLGPHISCGKELFIQSAEMSSASLEGSTASKDMALHLVPGLPGRGALDPSLNLSVPRFPPVEAGMITGPGSQNLGCLGHRLAPRKPHKRINYEVGEGGDVSFASVKFRHLH